MPRPKSLIAVSVKVIRLATRDTADTAKSKIDSQEGMVVVAAAEETVMREEKEEEEKNSQAHRDDTNIYGYSLGKNGWLLIPGVLQDGGP